MLFCCTLAVVIWPVFSEIVVGLLQLFKLVDDDRDVRLIDRDEVRVVEQALDGEELLFLLLLDDADILAELNEISVIFLLGFLFFLLAKNKIDLISNSHPFVLFVIIDAVSYRISGLSLDQSSDLLLLLVHGLLRRYELFELID